MFLFMYNYLYYVKAAFKCCPVLVTSMICPFEGIFNAPSYCMYVSLGYGSFCIIPSIIGFSL